ncbi:hypothetical protein PCH_Pc16g14600 [Penicillium rubens Wisconsin 54-1255]|uniref:Uncharacterized protein n=1 Tax=Penicillium rubens (strain ATCC 28089 / DSM 1075 / NRRL 1951 / Wisconsin 54-1255) TaxID=500485 RepID=B6HA06_PENRW|nr:hypothetical protein PCH_Pc16g14600 [Penicillium rubens Wisconsin 54-1255]
MTAVRKYGRTEDPVQIRRWHTPTLERIPCSTGVTSWNSEVDIQQQHPQDADLALNCPVWARVHAIPSEQPFCLSTFPPGSFPTLGRLTSYTFRLTRHGFHTFQPSGRKKENAKERNGDVDAVIPIDWSYTPLVADKTFVRCLQSPGSNPFNLPSDSQAGRNGRLPPVRLSLNLSEWKSQRATLPMRLGRLG